MMGTTLFKDKYRIKTTRLENWDYSRVGAYFVTICADRRDAINRVSTIFGNIIDGGMRQGSIGDIAHKYWMEIPKHYPNVELDEFIIMPNHVHGIIVINEKNDNVGTPQCRDAINRVSTLRDATINIKTGGITKKHNPMLNPYSLSTIIRWFKGRTTFEINKTHNNMVFQWQSRFYDHIIRNDDSLNKIREYIRNNPLKWESDNNNSDCYQNKKQGDPCGKY